MAFIVKSLFKVWAGEGKKQRCIFCNIWREEYEGKGMNFEYHL